MNKDHSVRNKRISVGIACILYFITIAVLFYEKNVMYGGSVDTGIIYAIIFPPVYFTLWYLRGRELFRREVSNQRLNLALDLLMRFLILVMAVLVCYDWYQDPFNLVLYLMFSLGVTVFAHVMISKVKPWIRKYYSLTVVTISVYCVVLLTCYLYTLVANPCTVEEAASMFEEYRYDSAEYLDYYDRDTVNLAANNAAAELNKYEDKLGFYLFRTRFEGVDYGSFVSITTGRLITSFPLDKSEYLTQLVNKPKSSVRYWDLR